VRRDLALEAALLDCEEGLLDLRLLFCTVRRDLALEAALLNCQEGLWDLRLLFWTEL